MTFTSVITVLLHSLRPVISAVLSLILAIGSSFGGPMGGYLELSAKTVKLSGSETNLSYEISLNIAEADKLLSQYYGEDEQQMLLSGIITEVSEEYDFFKVDENGILTLSDSFDIYTDPNNLRTVIESHKDNSLKIYADTSTIALSPKLTEKVLGYMSEEELSAYKKHMDGKSFYFPVTDVVSKELQAALAEIPVSEAEIIFDAASEMARKFALAMTSENFVATYVDMAKAVSESLSEYYSEEEADGCKIYKYRIGGMDYINSMADVYACMATGEFADNYVDLVEILIESLGSTVVPAISGFPAELTEDDAASLYTEILEVLTNLRTEYDTLVAMINDEQGEFSAYVPYLENSYIESTICEKDAKITSTYNAVISDGSIKLAEIKVTGVYADFNKEIPSPSTAVAFENRMSYELLDNKVGYEMAKEKGVSDIEIYWEAEMTPDTPLSTSSEGFYIIYKTTYSETFDYDDTLTEEEMEFLNEIYKDLPEYAYKDSSAHVIDGSVYLPLRQLMENAGYEVSWDSELRKAYVTVGSKKVEMTGTIINDKTYVKVRDFEKLGATVEYEEEIIYADAWNDFYKVCYATITFAE